MYMGPKFETTSENRDIIAIAKLATEIANGDFYYGPLEDKLRLIIALAEEVERKAKLQ